MHLAVDDHRVHGLTDVVDGDVADEPRVARLGVDLDDRCVRACRPGEVRRIVDRRLLEPRLHAVGKVVRGVGGERSLLDGHRPVRRALHAECAVRELEIVA